MSFSTAVSAMGAALLVALAAPTVMLLAAPWSLRDLDAPARKRMLRTSLIFAMIIGGVTLIPALILAAATDHPAATAGVTMAVGAALILWVQRTTDVIGRVYRLGEKLKVSKTRDAALTKLRELIAVTDASDQVGRQVLLSAATVLSNARLGAEALPVLESLDYTGFDERQLELRGLGIVDARTCAGDLAGARAALAELPFMPLDSIHARTATQLQARLLVFEGKPDQALAMLPEPIDDVTQERGRQAVRAHAFAALALHDELASSLAWIHQHHGEEGLLYVVEPEGPASRHARALLGEQTSAYR